LREFCALIEWLLTLTARDSVRYSIVASEWPGVKEHLSQLLRQGSSSDQ
jgi:hypothetical protein